MSNDIEIADKIRGLAGELNEYLKLAKSVGMRVNASIEPHPLVTGESIAVGSMSGLKIESITRTTDL